MKLSSWNGYVWIVVLLSSLLLIYKYIVLTPFGLITDDLMKLYKVDAVEIGFLAAAGYYTIVFGQLFAGLLYSKFSFKWLTVGSLTITVIGVLLFSSTTNYYFAFISRIIIGFGISFSAISYMKACATWFPANKFAFANSFIGTAAMLGAISSQVPLATLFSYVGWQEGLRITGYIGIFLIVIYALFMKDKKLNNHSEVHSKSAILYVLSNKDNWVLLLCSGLAFVPINAFAGLWGNSYLTTLYDISKKDASFLITFIYIGFAIGSPIIGKLSEYIECMKLMKICYFISLISLICAFYIDIPQELFAVFMFIYGFFVSSSLLTFTVARNINSLAVIALVVSLINIGEPIFGGLFDTLVGYFLDLYGQILLPNGNIGFEISSYKIAFLAMPIAMFISFICLYFVSKNKIIDKT